MRVLVGIDGSEKSLQALRYVSHFLKPPHDAVTLFFAPPSLKLLQTPDWAPEVAVQTHQILSQTVFRAAEAMVPSSFQRSMHTVEGEGEPAQGILAQAQRDKSDLVVVAAKSSKRTLPFFLGGVARHVAYHADVPVLVVRQHRELRENELRVLIACDDSMLWQDTCPVIEGLSWPQNTRISLLHVVEAIEQEQYDQLMAQSRNYLAYAGSALHEYQDYVAQQKEKCQNLLTASRETLPSIMHSADVHVVQGHVVEQIIKAVNELDIDLLVVGTRRMGSWHRMLGSTTASLLTQCRCSLLIGHAGQGA